MFLLISAFTPARSDIGTAGGAASLLRTGVGARALSLSGAFTAYYDDAACAYWNPGAIAVSKQSSVSTMFSWLTQNRSNSFLNIQFPTEYGSFAFNIINFSGGDDIEERLGDTPEFNLISDSENVFFLTYGRQAFNNIYMGLSLKYTRISIGSYGADGLSADLGALIKFNDFVSFGLMFQDLAGNLLWTTGTNEKIPLLMKFGVLLRFIEGDVKWSLDAEQNEFEGVSFKTGVEGAIIKIIYLRAGISYGASNYKFDYTFGGGLKYTFGGFLVKLDYCFLKEEFYTSFEANHKMSLDVYFSI